MKTHYHEGTTGLPMNVFMFGIFLPYEKSPERSVMRSMLAAAKPQPHQVPANLDTHCEWILKLILLAEQASFTKTLKRPGRCLPLMLRMRKGQDSGLNAMGRPQICQSEELRIKNPRRLDVAGGYPPLCNNPPKAYIYRK